MYPFSPTRMYLIYLPRYFRLEVDETCFRVCASPYTYILAVCRPSRSAVIHSTLLFSSVPQRITEENVQIGIMRTQIALHMYFVTRWLGNSELRTYVGSI